MGTLKLTEQVLKAKKPMQPLAESVNHEFLEESLQ
jgi:hypothetical protein